MNYIYICGITHIILIDSYDIMESPYRKTTRVNTNIGIMIGYDWYTGE